MKLNHEFHRVLTGKGGNVDCKLEFCELRKETHLLLRELF